MARTPQASSLLCDCVPRWVSTSGLHGTEWRTLVVTLKACVDKKNGAALVQQQYLRHCYSRRGAGICYPVKLAHVLSLHCTEYYKRHETRRGYCCWLLLLLLLHRTSARQGGVAGSGQSATYRNGIRGQGYILNYGSIASASPISDTYEVAQESDMKSDDDTLTHYSQKLNAACILRVCRMLLRFQLF